MLVSTRFPKCPQCKQLPVLQIFLTRARDAALVYRTLIQAYGPFHQTSAGIFVFLQEVCFHNTPLIWSKRRVNSCICAY